MNPSSPTPWKVVPNGPGFAVKCEAEEGRCVAMEKTDCGVPLDEGDARAIADAVNHTYGIGIPPEMVPELARKSDTLISQWKRREDCLRDIKAAHTRWSRGESSANDALNWIEHLAVSVWQREEEIINAGETP